MSYQDPIYLFLLLPFTLIIYQLLNKKYRYLLLLLVSYGFAYLITGKKIIIIAITSAFVYTIGRAIGSVNDKCKAEVASARKDKELKKKIKSIYNKKSKRVLVFGMVVIILILAVLKYCGFFAESVNYVTNLINGSSPIPVVKLLVPIGISFYSLQAIGYLTDVYWKKTAPEKNFFKLALFLAFFPTIMEGPICSYVDIKDKLFSGEDVRNENLSDGYVRILWGLFKKIIVADRLYVIVNTLFDASVNYNGAYIAIAAIAYTVQLYMEFSGCMDIVIGSARLFGITLMENFRQPFLAKNASEFWRRWHISLGVWFKTYIFYPVSMSKMAKKWKQFGTDKLNKYFTRIGLSAMALFPVWFCNGLWHGPKWNYIFYGMYYFVIIMLEQIMEPIRNGFTSRFKIGEKNKIWNGFLLVKTWIIIFTGELFFNASSLKHGFKMFFAMFRDFNLRTFVDGSIFSLGLGRADLVMAMIGAVVVFVVGIIREKNTDMLGSIRGMKLPVRWAIYITLIVCVVIFGAYGPGYQEVDLIYAGF